MMEEEQASSLPTRLSTIRDLGLILIMKDGSIIEQGTHDELIAKAASLITLSATASLLKFRIK